MLSGEQLFSVARDPNMPPLDLSMITPEIEDQVRCISYDFGPDFFDLRSIGTRYAAAAAAAGVAWTDARFRRAASSSQSGPGRSRTSA